MAYAQVLSWVFESVIGATQQEQEVHVHGAATKLLKTGKKKTPQTRTKLIACNCKRTYLLGVYFLL